MPFKRDLPMAKAEDGELGPPEAKRRPLGRLQKVRDIMPDGLKMSRKAIRKEMRNLKKSKRNAYNTKQKMPTLEDRLTAKYQKQVERKEAAKREAEELEKRKRKNAMKREAKEARKKRYDKAEKLRLQEEEEKRRVETAEEQEIKKLEKQLHMNKRKSKSLPKAFIDEGLDYILDCIDPEKTDTVREQDKNDAWTAELAGDDGEDETVMVGGERGDESESEDDSDEGEDDSEGEDNSEEELDEDMSDGDEEGVVSVGSEVESAEESAEESGEESEEEGGELSDYGGLDSDENIQPQSDNEDDDVSGEEEEDGEEVEADEEGSDPLEGSEDGESGEDESDENELKEDIYGRLRDSKGNVVSSGAAYVPPARRRQLEGTNDEARKQRLVRLKKQLKGQLNRLSDSNMVSISNHIESLYREQSRADMNDCLRELVTDMALSDIITPERLSMELAMLVALLHNNIGTEIGATFLESLADMFNSLHAESTDRSKKIENVSSFLCHLYSFQITHSVLITDIIYTLIDSFKDKDVELILLMLKNIGFTLRKDDPSTLKDIILKTQKKANDADVDSFKDKSRVKFMLEILLAIKNNNMRKIPNYDTTHMDHLKKLLKGYIKGGSLHGGQLRITYKDLLEAQSKGKWWVVGSAWQGSQVDSSNSLANITQPSPSQNNKTQNKFSKALLELARKQRMNTENRRLIFCTIMSAEDFVDAFERLLKLGLKTQQEREIITVILECCCNESTYNAYYTHLMSKFITYHRRFLFTLQTTMWDRFKIMNSQSDSCIHNLAQLAGQIILDEILPLSLLKNIEFGELNKHMVKFLKALLSRIFKADKKLIAEIFFKVGAGGVKLRHLKEGLELFMHHFMLRKCKEADKHHMEMSISAAENGLNMNRDAVAF